MRGPRSFTNDVVKRVRDRRRKSRKRLEEIFSRKTFTSVAVTGAMGKLIENSVVPFLDPSASVPWTRVWAWVVVFVFAVAVSIYWERVSSAAEDVADVVEEKTDVDDGG